MSANIDSFQCSICTETFVNPVECLNCGNNYCYECFMKVQEMEEKINEESKCPLCNNFPFSVKPNEVLKRLVSNLECTCKKCSKSFLYSEYQQHKLKCKIYFCKICNKQFSDPNVLINHFNNEKFHKDYIISVMNNREKKNPDELLQKVKKDLNIDNINGSNLILKNSLNSNSNINYNKFDLNDESIKIVKVELKPIYTIEEVRKIRFLDLISYKEKDSKDNNNNIIEYLYDLNILNRLPKTNKYYKNEDLIYCGKNNQIKCKCCKNHLCIPGNCMCFYCMNLNKKYHKINSNYLINKKGRVCKYDKCFNCNICYKIINKDSDGNAYSKIIKCINKNKCCEDCKCINKIFGFYFDKDTINNLNKIK